MSTFLNRLHLTKAPKGEGAQAQAPPPTLANDLEIQAASQANTVDEKGNPVNVDDNAADLKQEQELPDLDAQRGVQKVEAVTLSWTRKSLAAMLIMYARPCGLLSKGHS